ncbi:thioredoxin family protein [Gracilibacillus kekensis]|uniref:Thioredoxin n=1 Tax=Gracilibacillus kekensis TaxID=1027249 RepID=A0A1M7MR39_9BACI|nr:thioredoxin family protein [Gracilibacillus kekensis]SHM93432.1 Thioredoxin [Gracilibacillus kekensis]
MIEVTIDSWKQLQQDREKKVFFVHTPFCATCQLAERMLAIIEETKPNQSFYRLNASFFPGFMEKNKIKSVPALLLVEKGVVRDHLYAFESVTKLHEVLEKWH